MVKEAVPGWFARVPRPRGAKYTSVRFGSSKWAKLQGSIRHEHAVFFKNNPTSRHFHCFFGFGCAQLDALVKRASDKRRLCVCVWDDRPILKIPSTPRPDETYWHGTTIKRAYSILFMRFSIFLFRPSRLASRNTMMHKSFRSYYSSHLSFPLWSCRFRPRLIFVLLASKSLYCWVSGCV